MDGSVASRKRALNSARHIEPEMACRATLALRHSTEILPAIPGVKVRNPLSARGGQDPEPIAHAKLLAPVAFRTQERAVTEDDYAAAAERHPDVQRAAATRRWTGSWYTMFITY
jgi:hypothetical protein